MGKITSRDIAKMAGVSVSTVSIVMNRKNGVSDETRERVLNILAENGIFPHGNAQSSGGGILRFCKIAKHGNIINNRHTVFIADYIDGIVEEAKRLNYSVEFATFNMIPIAEVVDNLRGAHGVAGYIILSTELSEDDILKFSSLPTPVVFLDAMFPYMPGAFVTMDNYGMVYDVLSYLSSLGHRRIGMLAAEGGSNFLCRRLAFCQGMKALGLELDENLIFVLNSTHSGSYEDMKTVLERGSLKTPIAFFACNDMVAIGAVRALSEYHLKVPEDVSIIGFDDLPASSLVSPALTSVSVPKREIGMRSVRMLVDRVSGDCQLNSERCVLGGNLVVRSSVRQLS